jgi:hypothetical protein
VQSAGALYHIPEIRTRARGLGDNKGVMESKLCADTPIEKFRFVAHVLKIMGPNYASCAKNMLGKFLKMERELKVQEGWDWGIVFWMIFRFIMV